MMKCSKCNRTFKTNAALKQHMTDFVHGGAQPKRKNKTSAVLPGISAPLAGYGTQDINLRFKRRELFTTVRTEANKSSGYTYAAFSPSTIGTAMKVLAKSFEMYRLHSARLVYKTMVSTMKDGQVIVGIDYDWKTSVTLTKDKALTLPNVSFPVYSDGAVLQVRTDSQPRFITPQDARDKPFMVYIYWSVASGAAIDLGDLFMDLDIEFFGINAA